MKRKSKEKRLFFHFKIDYRSIYLAIMKVLLVTSNLRRSH